MEANVEKLVCEGSMAMARKLRSYHIVTSVLPSENYYLGWWKSRRVGKSNCWRRGLLLRFPGLSGARGHEYVRLFTSTSLIPHFQTIRKFWQLHLKNIPYIQPLLSTSNDTTLVSAISISLFDYCSRFLPILASLKGFSLSLVFCVLNIWYTRYSFCIYPA